MSALVKCLLLAVALLCFAQHVEMGRVIRDEPKPLEKELHELQEISNNLLEKIKANFDEDTLKSIREAFKKTFEAGVHATKGKIDELTAEVKKKNEESKKELSQK